MDDAGCMNCKDALAWAAEQLSTDEYPTNSAELLLESLLGLSRHELYASDAALTVLTKQQLKTLCQWMLERKRGKPLQYITGKTRFIDLDILCKEPVLIPRSETELLAEWAATLLKAQIGPAEVLDLCSGTGCIGLYVASHVPEAAVTLSDISEEAVLLARENAAYIACAVSNEEGALQKEPTAADNQMPGEAGAPQAISHIDVVRSDLFSGLPQDLRQKLCLITANPPYIPEHVYKTLPSEVKDYEDPRALITKDAAGLSYFFRIIDEAPQWLAPFGWVALELFEDSLTKAKQYLEQKGVWQRCEIHHDLNQRPRFITAQYNPHQESVMLFNTDTVAGLGCWATPANPAYDRIFSIKGREKHKKLPLFIPSASELSRYAGGLTQQARNLAHAHWPGGLTLIVTASKEVPREYVAADGSVALRVPEAPELVALIQRAGVPLANTSANYSGKPAVASIDEVDQGIKQAADVTLTYKAAASSIASTVIDVRGPGPYTIVREGSLRL